MDIQEFFLENDVEPTLKVLLDHSNDDQLTNDIIGITHQYKDLKRNVALSLITYEQQVVRLSQIRGAVMHFINEFSNRNIAFSEERLPQKNHTVTFDGHEEIYLEDIYKLQSFENDIEEISQELAEVRQGMLENLNELPLITDRINILSKRYNQMAENMESSNSVNIPILKKRTKKYFNDFHIFSVKLLTTIEDLTEDIKDVTIIQLLLMQEIIMENGEIAIPFLDTVKSNYKDLKNSLQSYVIVVKGQLDDIEKVIKELKPFVNTSKMKGAKKNLRRTNQSLNQMISYSDKFFEGYHYLTRIQ